MTDSRSPSAEHQFWIASPYFVPHDDVDRRSPLFKIGSAAARLLSPILKSEASLVVR